jgi:hypothetical protein
MFENIYDMKCERLKNTLYGCKLFKSPEYDNRERPHHSIFGIKKISVKSDHKTIIEKDKIYFKNEFENMLNCDTKNIRGGIFLFCQSTEGRPEVLIRG